MIKIVDSNTFGNWKVFRKCVTGIKFANAYPKFSLDRPLTHIAVSGVGMGFDANPTFSIGAKKVVEVIGKDAFKKLIENTWEPKYYNYTIIPPDSLGTLYRVFHGFSWAKTPEGTKYWANVVSKLGRIR